MPGTLEEPVVVSIHDLQTGEEIRSRRYESLSRYLDALEKSPSQNLP